MVVSGQVAHQAARQLQRMEGDHRAAIVGNVVDGDVSFLCRCDINAIGPNTEAYDHSQVAKEI